MQKGLRVITLQESILFRILVVAIILSLTGPLKGFNMSNSWRENTMYSRQ